jgi:hypothetical protein
MRSRRATSREGLLLAALVLCTGCSDMGTVQVERETAPPPARMSVAPSASAHDQARFAYVSMWRDVTAASRTSDYRSPRLSLHAVGDALALMVHGLKLDREQGLISLGAPVFNPVISQLAPQNQPTKAVIRDCVSDTNWRLVDVKTGDPATKGSTPGWHKVDATVTKQRLTWRVTKLRIWETGTCAG